MEDQRNSKSEVQGLKDHLKANVFNLLFTKINFEEVSSVEMVVNMKTITQEGDPIILIPGLEGFSKVFETLAEELDGNFVCMQLPYLDIEQTPVDFARAFLEVTKYFPPKSQKIITFVDAASEKDSRRRKRNENNLSLVRITDCNKFG